VVDYEQYIKSDDWERRRKIRIQIGVELAGKPVCEWCRQHAARTEPIEVHHLTYERLGREDCFDLMVLCRCCHRDIEKRIRNLVATRLKREAAMSDVKPECVERIRETFEYLKPPSFEKER
jgi:hypothetical protein